MKVSFTRIFLFVLISVSLFSHVVSAASLEVIASNLEVNWKMNHMEWPKEIQERTGLFRLRLGSISTTDLVATSIGEPNNLTLGHVDQLVSDLGDQTSELAYKRSIQALGHIRFISPVPQKRCIVIFGYLDKPIVPTVILQFDERDWARIDKGIKNY